MTRVLSIIPTPYVSGLQNLTLDYFARLPSEWTCHFLLTRWSNGDFARRLDTLNIPYSSSWFGMFSRRLDPHNLKMTLHCASKLPILYSDYHRLIRAFSPDVILTANYHELLLLWPVLYRSSIPIVCHMHDPAPAEPFYKFTARFYDRLVTRYIAISRSVADRMAQLGIARDKMTLLHNGIPLERFRFFPRRSDLFVRRYGWPDDVVIVGITGQMMEAKGHEDLVEAIRLLDGSLPRIRLIIGGKPSEPFASHLYEQVRSNGLEKHVVFSGWQTNIADFYAGIDIFVLPSRQEEGFGLVVVEAMASGVPVVAARSGGVQDIINDGVTGLMVEKRRPDMIAASLQLLLRDSDLSVRLRIAGRDRVEKMFNLSDQAQIFANILNDVAGTPSIGL